MIRISAFPQDEHLWFVKWVDDFKLPHLGTRSASVAVLLQRLPFDDQRQLNRLKSQDLLTIFGKKYQDADPQFFYPLPRVHVGTLPVIPIGAVFCNRRLVGYLPAHTTDIVLLHAEESCQEVELNTLLPKPDGWNDKPYKLLNTSEYCGLNTRFSSSRCLQYHRDDTDFIIPRTVIFSRFYAGQPEIARAFCGGPWPEQVHKLIYFGDLESGLQTGICPETGKWHVILETKIRDAFARIIAIFHFDPYARACAESIYGQSLRDRGLTQIHGSWFSNARIPFRASETPLKLKISGYFLKSIRNHKLKTERKKFLVTMLGGCNQPSYIPEILYERYNSNYGSESPTEVDGPSPYSPAQTVRNPNTNTIIDDERDSLAQGDIFEIPTNDFDWIDAKPLEKLKKSSNKVYPPKPHPAPSSSGDDSASTGEPTHQHGNVAQAQIKTLHRSPELRFEQLLIALEELYSTGHLENFNLIQPSLPSLLIQRGSRVCWSYLNAEARTTGEWPTRSWRLIQSGSDDGYRKVPGIPRCALVVEIKKDSHLGYWIETECKKGDSYLSVFIHDLRALPEDVVELAMDAIAANQGTNLRKHLPDILSPYGLTSYYRHHFEKDRISPASLLKFFDRAGF